MLYEKSPSDSDCGDFSSNGYTCNNGDYFRVFGMKKAWKIIGAISILLVLAIVALWASGILFILYAQLEEVQIFDNRVEYTLQIRNSGTTYPGQTFTFPQSSSNIQGGWDVVVLDGPLSCNILVAQSTTTLGKAECRYTGTETLTRSGQYVGRIKFLAFFGDSGVAVGTTKCDGIRLYTWMGTGWVYSKPCPYKCEGGACVDAPVIPSDFSIDFSYTPTELSINEPEVITFTFIANRRFLSPNVYYDGVRIGYSGVWQTQFSASTTKKFTEVGTKTASVKIEGNVDPVWTEFSKTFTATFNVIGIPCDLACPAKCVGSRLLSDGLPNPTCTDCVYATETTCPYGCEAGACLSICTPAEAGMCDDSVWLTDECRWDNNLCSGGGVSPTECETGAVRCKFSTVQEYCDSTGAWIERNCREGYICVSESGMCIKEDVEVCEKIGNPCWNSAGCRGVFIDVNGMCACDAPIECGNICSPIPDKSCEEAEWVDYPDCEWDTSDCEGGSEEEVVIEDWMPVAVGVMAVLSIIMILGYYVYTKRKR